MRTPTPSSATRILTRWGYVVLVMMLAGAWWMARHHRLAHHDIPMAQSTGKTIALHEASPAELSLLPGIGPGLAQRIVQDRQKHGHFTQSHDILRVPGIGPRTLQRILPYIHIDPMQVPVGRADRPFPSPPAAVPRLDE